MESHLGPLLNAVLVRDWKTVRVVRDWLEGREADEGLVLLPVDPGPRRRVDGTASGLAGRVGLKGPGETWARFLLGDVEISADSQLVARHRNGRSWSVLLRRGDVGRVQRTLDEIDRFAEETGGRYITLEQLDAHLDRLFASAKAMAFATVPERGQVKTAIFETLKANGMRDGVHVRLMVTRGVKSTPYQDPRATISPHDESGGCAPKPRKERAASRRIAEAARKVVSPKAKVAFHAVATRTKTSEPCARSSPTAAVTAEINRSRAYLATCLKKSA